MGRFVERYNKHPEKGVDYYIDQARAYAASLSLARGFGESADGYFARNPSAAKMMKECKDDIEFLQRARS